MLEIITIRSLHCVVPALLQLQAQDDRYERIRAKLAGVQKLPSDEGQVSTPTAMKSLNHEPGIDAAARLCGGRQPCNGSKTTFESPATLRKISTGQAS